MWLRPLYKEECCCSGASPAPQLQGKSNDDRGYGSVILRLLTCGPKLQTVSFGSFSNWYHNNLRTCGYLTGTPFKFAYLWNIHNIFEDLRFADLHTEEICGFAIAE
jgi:hypothetical protein